MSKLQSRSIIRLCLDSANLRPIHSADFENEPHFDREREIQAKIGAVPVDLALPDGSDRSGITRGGYVFILFTKSDANIFL